MKNKVLGRLLAAYKKSRVLMASLITLIVLLPSMAFAKEVPVLVKISTVSVDRLLSKFWE